MRLLGFSLFLSFFLSFFKCKVAVTRRLRAVPQRSFKEGSDPVRRRIACGPVDENETWT
jgi:hypothetical protein